MRWNIKENIHDEGSLKENSIIEGLLINKKKWCLWTCLISSKVKIRSSRLNCTVPVLIIAETHFIPEQIPFFLLWFSLIQLLGSEHQRLLLRLHVRQKVWQMALLFSFSFSSVLLDRLTKVFFVLFFCSCFRWVYRSTCKNLILSLPHCPLPRVTYRGDLP